ncbi:hypothetical protein KY290_027290 [Solanum tuberosum]|uniref:RNase H type-1 domain-containing protein n=1 Tax=Solanum tuberosum TaxID=4113 RepID=A0ABQ7UGE2_SOLTU|nr:hypothetical protein KY290_027290 [Solanum tuberosum]
MHQCLPTILCWEIWKSRCNARFEGIKASTYRIIERVTWLMTLILNKQFPCLNFAGNWKELCIKIERVNPVLNIKFIKWREPLDNYLKLNTDGCSKGNPGEAGGGGILRDHQGNINMAFQTYFGNCSNNMAEGLAILRGLQWCATNLLHNVIIETDSMIMVDMIKGKNVMMWQMQDIVMQITKIMKEGNFQINHCFREANSVADALANIGVTEKHEAFFTSTCCLPRQVKVALKNDQDGLPNIRIRVRKGHFNFLT